MSWDKVCTAEDVIRNLSKNSNTSLYDELYYLAMESTQWPVITNKPAAVQAVVETLQMATCSNILTKALAVLDAWVMEEASTGDSYYVADTILKQQGVRAMCATIDAHAEVRSSHNTCHAYKYLPASHW